MIRFDQVNKRLYKEQVVPATKYKPKHKANLAIAEIKLGKDWTLGRVMHTERPTDFANQAQVELRYKGQPVVIWRRGAHNSVEVNFEHIVADERIVNYNHVVDKVREWVPEFWFAYVPKGYSNEAFFAVAKPVARGYGKGSGTFPTAHQTLVSNKAYVVEETRWEDSKTVREVVVYGAAPDNVWGWDWQRARRRDAAFQRIRTNFRSRERKVERAYLAAMYAWNVGCGAREWKQKQDNERAAKLRELQGNAVDRWLKRWGVEPYMLDGKRTVDLYKRCITAKRTDGTTSEYMSQSFSRERIEYLPGTRPWDPHFAPHNGCGGGLHMCAKPEHTRSYVSGAKVVVCPVRVDEIVLIGFNEHSPERVDHIDKVKVPRVWGLIKEHS